MSATTLPVSAIILAGGRATRFGGEDKGLIALAGRPLVDWVARRLAGRVDEILVSANRETARYAALGFDVVADTLADYPGPIAGFVAAGHQARNEWLLTVPCDCPFLPDDLVPRLLDAAVNKGMDLVRAADAKAVHYTVMLARRGLIADAEAFLAAGGRKVQTWQERHVCGKVRFDATPNPFFNINSPDDLAQAERLLAGDGA